MQLSRRVARFNKVFNNRIQGLYAWLVPPWAVILHRGRRTGRAYRTPVLAFRQDTTLIIALLYGNQTEWLKNLRARDGLVVRGGRAFELAAQPRVVSTRAAAELAALPALVRGYCRLADNQVIITVGSRRPGFGPHRSHQPVSA